MGRVSERLSARHDPAELLRAGLIATAAGGVALLLAVLVGAGLAGVLPALFVTVSSIGVIVPNAAALALAGHPSIAGSASGLLGLAQFALGAVAAPLVGLAGEDTAVPMALVIAVLGVAALGTFALLAGRTVPGHASS
jgi:DHA1 family bicyclomycin/chloramphenicol resistance-like MFS transporter